MSLFVTFEGIDGSGKTSTMKALKQKLVEHHFSVYSSQEPGGSEIRNAIRDTIVSKNLEPLSQLYLFLADRVEHIVQLKLAAKYNDILFSDRYADSTIAYQAFGNEVDIWGLFHNPGDALTMGFNPDLTFYLKIPYREARDRIEDRGEKLSFFEKQGEGFYRKVIAGYEEQAKYNPFRIKTIEVEGKNLEEIVEECFLHMMNKLKEKIV